MLQEGREVRARTERAEMQDRRSAPCGRVRLGARFMVDDAAFAKARANTLAPVSGSFTSRAASLAKCCKAWLPSAQKAAAVGVGIDVEHRFGLQFGGMRFGPFGGTQQTRLLAVPARIHQGAARPPAFLDQFADRLWPPPSRRPGRRADRPRRTPSHRDGCRE